MFPIDFVINILRPVIGDLKIENDRENQTITFKRKAEEKTITYAELAEAIEKAFSDE